jgi:hypothetical protein
MFEKMFEKKFAKKVRKYYKLLEGREGGEAEGGELSFQCLRPSTSLMAAGKNKPIRVHCSIVTELCISESIY